MLKKLKVSISLLLAVLMMVSIFAIGGPEVEPPVRYGAWLDEIVVTLVARDLAIPKIQAGALDVYAVGLVCPEKFEIVLADPELGYELVFGGFSGLAWNPAGTPEDPTFADGRLNPFAVPRIREAMQWLIDRTYIVEEFWGGMATPRYLPLHPVFPDYARAIGVGRALELYYAYDPVRGEGIFIEEMYKLGSYRIDGIWQWKGEPVEIIILGRIGDPREPLAHYMAALFERLGFHVDLMVKTWAEAAPFWVLACAYEGLMHFKTAGWITTAVSRDQAGTFDFHYTTRSIPRPFFLARKPAPELDYLSDRLARRDFACLEERAELFERILPAVMECGLWTWVASAKGIQPRRADISVAADLAGGIGGARLWALTSRFVDPVTGEPLVGGTMRVGLATLIPSPWNPIDGCNLGTSHMMYRATGDVGLMMDPFTGLMHPQRIERAEVYVKEGLPVGITHDWLDLHFVPRMEVPTDAWVDWCAIAQRFITLAEAVAKEDFDPERLTANVRVRVHFPADLFDVVKWHDGSPLSIADFVMRMIMFFDRAKEASAIFDPAAIPVYRAFMGHFRGVRIVSEDPLIIESYTDRIFMDAEWVADWSWFPYFDRGSAGWHNMAVGILAETAKELTFGAARAGVLEVEWMSFIAGPSLPILERHMLDAKAAGFVPFEPTLGQFITPAEVAARWANVESWFEERGHFWIGTGPFYLVAAHPLERIVHLRRFPYFPDPAERWVGFAAPIIAEVEVIGPTVVRAGDEAVFDIEVTFEGEPYPVADVDFVTYLLIDALGKVVYVGEAVAVHDGLWRVMLPEETTATLAIGSTRLELVVAPIIVAKPTFAATVFLLLP